MRAFISSARCRPLVEARASISPLFGDEADDFDLACVGSFSVDGFAAHLGAILFDF